MENMEEREAKLAVGIQKAGRVLVNEDEAYRLARNLLQTLEAVEKFESGEASSTFFIEISVARLANTWEVIK